jgi:hypothetical protein
MKISVVFAYWFSIKQVVVLKKQIQSMKTRIILTLIIIIVLFESCARSFTPYEAANHPRGKKCGVIR